MQSPQSVQVYPGRRMRIRFCESALYRHAREQRPHSVHCRSIRIRNGEILPSTFPRSPRGQKDVQCTIVPLRAENRTIMPTPMTPNPTAINPATVPSTPRIPSPAAAMGVAANRPILRMVHAVPRSVVLRFAAAASPSYDPK